MLRNLGALMVVLAAVLTVGFVGFVGAAEPADDGSVPWPGAVVEEWGFEEVEPGFGAEILLWWRVDWQCFSACWKECYKIQTQQCFWVSWSAKLYSACMKAAALYCTGYCLAACKKG